MKERVEAVHGPLDGEVVTIGKECSALGFFIHSDDPEAENCYWYGYFDWGTRNPDGLRVFGLGKPR